MSKRAKIETIAADVCVITDQRQQRLTALEAELRRWPPQCRGCDGTGQVPAVGNTVGPCLNCREARRLLGS